jgi:hypothetical protein
MLRSVSSWTISSWNEGDKVNKDAGTLNTPGIRNFRTKSEARESGILKKVLWLLLLILVNLSDSAAQDSSETTTGTGALSVVGTPTTDDVPRLLVDYGTLDARTGWRRIAIEPEGFSFLVPVAVDIKREETRSADYVYDQTTVFSLTSLGFFSIGRTITVNHDWGKELKTALDDETTLNDLFIGLERQFRGLIAGKDVYVRGLGRGIYEGYPSREFILFRDGKVGRGRVIINLNGFFIIYALPADEALSAIWIDRFFNSISFKPNL